MPTVELVQVSAADGVRLDGAWQAAPAGATSALEVDAAILVHGTGANFYGSTLMEHLAAALADQATAVLRVNTRGHDLMCTLGGGDGPRLGGAAYERVSDCAYDLSAWVEWAQQRGAQRIALVGHSLGALKSIYALAQEAAPRVARLVAISPPRLSYQAFMVSEKRDEFLAQLTEAQYRVDAGEGQTLLSIRFPLPYTLTAAGFVDKYGPLERYHVLPLLPSIGCPVLVVYGSLEVATNVAFREMPSLVEALPPGRAVREVAVVAGADHFYSSARSELSSRVVRWLRRSLASGTVSD